MAQLHHCLVAAWARSLHLPGLVFPICKMGHLIPVHGHDEQNLDFQEIRFSADQFNQQGP